MARITDVQKITEIIATAKIVFLLAEMNWRIGSPPLFFTVSISYTFFYSNPIKKLLQKNTVLLLFDWMIYSFLNLRFTNPDRYCII